MPAPALSLAASLRLPLIKAHLRRIKPETVLEAGCGNGAMAYRLAQRFEYRGYEPDQTSFQTAQSRLRPLGRGAIFNSAVPSTPDRTFDLLVAFEVLEHIEDDQAALREWFGWVRPGGHIILSVPAHPQRFGPSDLAVGHYRRYTYSGLSEVLSGSGLSVEAIESWGMPLGYLLEWGRNVLHKRNSSSPTMAEGTARSGRLWQPPSGLGRLVEWGVTPVALLQSPFRSTDHGIGYVALASVPE